MSARDALRAAVNGKPPDPTADDLSAALGLTEHGLKVVGANVFGRGPNASVDVHLSDGSKLTFERFSDITKPAMLAAYLVTCTGVVSTFKGPQAGAIAAAIYKLAKHHADEGDDDVILDCAVEFLRLAPTLDVTMSEQADRWRAFSVLATDDGLHANPEDRSARAIAQRSTVLVDVDSGRRLVRTGWLQSYVRADVGGVYSPAALAIRVQRVGWSRPNSEGRVKATNPTDGRTLGWSFYVIPADWDSGQVPAGSGSNARVRTHTRKTNEPAGTRNLNGRVQGVASVAVPTATDGLDDLGAEVDDTLADALPAGVCCCDPPGPPWTDTDGDARCAKCGRGTGQSPS